MRNIVQRFYSLSGEKKDTVQIYIYVANRQFLRQWFLLMFVNRISLFQETMSVPVIRAYSNPAEADFFHTGYASIATIMIAIPVLFLWATSMEAETSRDPSKSFQIPSLPLPVVGPHPIIPSVSALLSSTPPSCFIALINVGILRGGLSSAVQDRLHFLVESLSECQVDVFWCSEEGARSARIERQRFGLLSIHRAYYFDSNSLYDRMDRCYRMIREDKSATGEWDRYGWVVRHRPDLIWHHPPPRISTLRNDTVYARVRQVRNDAATDLELSQWFGDSCPPNVPPCVLKK